MHGFEYKLMPSVKSSGEKNSPHIKAQGKNKLSWCAQKMGVKLLRKLSGIQLELGAVILIFSQPS